MDWSINLEVEDEGLCTLKVNEINDKIVQWSQYLRENE